MERIKNYKKFDIKFTEIEKIFLEIDGHMDWMSRKDYDGKPIEIRYFSIEDDENQLYYKLDYEKKEANFYDSILVDEVRKEVVESAHFYIMYYDLSDDEEYFQNEDEILDIAGKRCWEKDLTDRYFITEKEKVFNNSYNRLLELLTEHRYKLLQENLSKNKDKDKNKIVKI